MSIQGDEGDPRDRSHLRVIPFRMGISPEYKYVMERHCDTAERFVKVLDFYRHSRKEEREYFDGCFKAKYGKTFGAYFAPLVRARKRASDR